MKQITLFLLSCFLIIACKQENITTNIPNKAEELKNNIDKTQVRTQARSYTAIAPYQQLAPQVKFYIDPISGKMDTREQHTFIKNSGLPLEPEFEVWSDTHTLQEAIHLFDNYSNMQGNNKYINTFKQYEGWLLLTHYDLLSANSEGSVDNVKLILNRLIEAKYEGYGLLYYTLDYLRSKDESSSVLSNFASKIIESSTSSSNPHTTLAETDVRNNGKPLPPGLLDMVNKHIKQKSAKNTYLEQIRTFL